MRGQRAREEIALGQQVRALGHSSFPFKIFTNYIIMRQNPQISVGNIVDAPPIPLFLRSYMPFF